MQLNIQTLTAPVNKPPPIFPKVAKGIWRGRNCTKTSIASANTDGALYSDRSKAAKRSLP